MEQAALPGSIMLPASTLRLIEGYVQVRPVGPISIKGLPDPVEAYEVLGPGPARTRLQLAAARGLTRFVGRAREMEQLGAALAQAQAGHGQVVAVVGEPGVGKSRLFWEFTRSHRTQGWLVLESGSVSYGRATPYLPLIDLLKAYLQIDARDESRRLREKVTGKLLTLDETLRSLLPAVLGLPAARWPRPSGKSIGIARRSRAAREVSSTSARAISRTRCVCSRPRWSCRGASSSG